MSISPDVSEQWHRKTPRLVKVSVTTGGGDMGKIPGGSTEFLYKDFKGKEADRLVTRIDPTVIALAAELRVNEAAEELGQTRPQKDFRAS